MEDQMTAPTAPPPPAPPGAPSARPAAPAPPITPPRPSVRGLAASAWAWAGRHRAACLVIVLALLVLELALYGLVRYRGGWGAWLAIHAVLLAAGALVLWVRVALRRRQTRQAALKLGATPGPGGPGRTPGPTRTRMPGAPRGGLLGGLRGLAGRLLGRGGTRPAGGTRPPGGTRSPGGGLLGGLRNLLGGGGTRPSPGGARGGLLGGLRNLLGGGGTRSTGGPGGRPTGGPTTRTRTGGRSGARYGGPGLFGRLRNLRDRIRGTGTPPTSRTTRTNTPTPTTRPTPPTRTGTPEEKRMQPTQPTTPDPMQPSSPPRPPERGRGYQGAAPVGNPPTPRGRRWDERDVGLHRWGANLNLYGNGVEEAAKPSRDSTQLVRALAVAARQHATDAAADLPVSSRLRAELETIAKEAEKIASEREALDARLAKVRGDAEALPGLYKIEHSGDEDRYQRPRGSHRQESAADVSRAVREN